jgi:hypothetical protein
MVRMLASSAVDRGFDPRLGQTKEYNIEYTCMNTPYVRCFQHYSWYGTRRVTLVAQELPILSEQNSSATYWGTWWSIFRFLCGILWCIHTCVFVLEIIFLIIFIGYISIFYAFNIRYKYFWYFLPIGGVNGSHARLECGRSWVRPPIGYFGQEILWTKNIKEWMSEWLLFNANSAIFSSYIMTRTS